MTKKKTTSKLKQDLQVLFNKYIRQRDSKDGKFTCISCGETKPVDQMNAGHFFNVRNYDGLRFDEDNVHGECAYCNCWNESHLVGYTLNLQNKIGLKRFNELLERTNEYKRTGVNSSIIGRLNKWDRLALEELIEHYKGKI